MDQKGLYLFRMCFLSLHPHISTNFHLQHWHFLKDFHFFFQRGIISSGFIIELFLCVSALGIHHKNNATVTKLYVTCTPIYVCMYVGL